MWKLRTADTADVRTGEGSVLNLCASVRVGIVYRRIQRLGMHGNTTQIQLRDNDEGEFEGGWFQITVVETGRRCKYPIGM